MLKFVCFCFILLPSSLWSQNITGRVYNPRTKLQNIEVINRTKKIKTITNEQGDFSILASLGDSLQIQSIFYKPFSMIVKQAHLDQTIVIELKEEVNNLDEVTLANTKTDALENAVKNNVTIKLQLQEDIKNNPYKYGPPPNSNPDFIKIIALIGTLFKKKNKTPSVEVATLEDIKLLFNSSPLFNETLLYQEFKIPKDYTHLFFEYCSVQHIDKSLFTKQQQLPLLDILLEHSQAFLTILSENGIPIKD